MSRYHRGTAVLLGAADVPSGVGGLFGFGDTVSTDAYVTKGYQVDLEMANVDALITRLARDAPTLDPSALQTWRAQKSEWDRYFAANIARPPLLPVISSSDSDAIETWLARVAGWKERASTWAAKSADPKLVAVARSIPSSPASVTRQETISQRDADAAKPMNLYFKIGAAIGAVAAVGYALRQVRGTL